MYITNWTTPDGLNNTMRKKRSRYLFSSDAELSLKIGMTTLYLFLRLNLTASKIPERNYRREKVHSSHAGGIQRRMLSWKAIEEELTFDEEEVSKELETDCMGKNE
ncbi:hypothetical protein HI914_00192 [Erysiphe necator]|nr:hypothetical protein HI914_00192 [Erysiphe necator]